MADERGRGNNEAEIVFAGAQGLFEFAEDLPGFAAAGCASDEFHVDGVANKRRINRHLYSSRGFQKTHLTCASDTMAVVKTKQSSMSRTLKKLNEIV